MTTSPPAKKVTVTPLGGCVFSVKNWLRPQILASEKDFLVVYKPPRMHSAPLSHSSSDNLFAWCAGKYPEIAGLSGRREGEGGLLHRLDFETQGLLLVARTQRGMEGILEQQKKGMVIKEYSALASKSRTILQGFPRETNIEDPVPASIRSAFRSYGYGGKAVRPIAADDIHETETREIVYDDGKPYVTDILETRALANNLTSFRLRIYRGFRHQIRCHLAWLGKPILNDDVYGGAAFGKGLLALRACSISLSDPSTASKRIYTIPELEPGDMI